MKSGWILNGRMVGEMVGWIMKGWLVKLVAG